MTHITLITIVHGRHEHLRHQHEAIAAGTLLPDRVLVVSMGDPDLVDVLEQGPLTERTVMTNVAAGGRLPLARARNHGARRALDDSGTDLLIFIDVDCLPAPEMIAGYLDAYRRTRSRSEPRLLCGPVAYLDPPRSGDGYGADELARARPNAARPAPSSGRIVQGDEHHLFWSLSFAIDPGSWARIGGFDEGYEGYGAEDTDYGQRARAAGASLFWVGSALAYHQWHPVSDPPLEHLEDIVRNANRFYRRWGWFPMSGWLQAFAVRGLIDFDPDRELVHLNPRD